MEGHSFIFTPGVWLGEGKILLSMLEEQLVFFTRWSIGAKDPKGHIECLQEIQVRGLSDVLVNHYTFFDMTPTTFHVLMDNYAVGKISGSGIIHPEMVGWEFRVKELGFEGFEFYEKQSDELYHVQGEFATSDDLRTKVQGRVWYQKDRTMGNFDE